MIDLKAEVYGVELERLGSIYYYNYLGIEKIEILDNVLVQTENGIEVGRVMMGPVTMRFEEIGYEPNSIIRRVGDDDKKQIEENVEKAKEVAQYAKQMVRALGLK
ncbi:MAG: PSP1 domain protein, partial [Petrotoga mobilis]